MPLVVQSRLKQPHVSIKCPLCSKEVEYVKPTKEALGGDAAFKIECASCSKQFDGPKAPATASRGRRIGTQENPIDLTYYQVLEVPPNADASQIKTSYRRLALKKHPDKLKEHERTPAAEEEFKLIAIAYAVLSDPVERKKYNEFGPSSKQHEEGFIDPEAVFSSLFGGEKLADIIGTISIGAELKSALQKESEEGADGTVEAMKEKSRKDMTPEERAAKTEKDRQEAAERAQAREERVTKLTAALLIKIAIFTEQARNGGEDPQVAASVKIEVQELKDESYGTELLNTVGAVYQAKARQYTASQSTPLGIGGWFHGVRSTAHVFSETVSTLRSAYELTDVFKELSLAEEKGLSEEDRKKLEEKAAAKGLTALFKGCKLEVESVVREVCDRIIYDTNISKDVASKRVAALDILGRVYASVRKDERIDESEYVRIDATQPNSKSTKATSNPSASTTGGRPPQNAPSANAKAAGTNPKQ